MLVQTSPGSALALAKAAQCRAGARTGLPRPRVAVWEGRQGDTYPHTFVAVSPGGAGQAQGTLG